MTTAELNPAALTGLVSETEGRTLAELAALGNDRAVVVEIGSYTGKSTCFLAEASPADVYAIDLWDLRLPTEKKKGRRNKHKYAVNFNSSNARTTFMQRIAAFPNVIPVQAPSNAIANVWMQPIGLLFIDGAHDTKSVTADYEGFARFIVPGGWLAMHDATPGSRVDKVIQDVIVPSGLWGERRQVERLAVFQRLEGMQWK